MDRTDMKEMFTDIIGGTSLDDSTIDSILTDSLRLLNQITAHIGVDFLTDYSLLVALTMQYYYDIGRRNYESAKLALKEIQNQAVQAHYDFVQNEQADWPNYMGDRG